MVWESIKCWAKAAPLRRSISPLSYRALRNSVLRCHGSLPHLHDKRVGILIGNRPLWGIYDIALTLKGAVVVPIPTFFSREQVEHIIEDSGIDTVIIESRKLVESGGLSEVFGSLRVLEADLSLESPLADDPGSEEIYDIYDPGRVAKIIYTSGTTGSPKGVMVRLGAMEAVTGSLIERSGANMSDRHLTLLPLSTLVETIGGLYVPLTVGGTILYPDPSTAPENILFNPSNLTGLLSGAAPTTLNLVPSLLEAILKGVNSRYDLPSTLRFVAVGGAPLLPALRKRAIELGVPLYQGYGLSECTSVVALNGAGRNREGSVGKVLRHAGVEISDDGEIMVSGAGLMSGYTNGPMSDRSSLATGDMGYIDEEGYLFVTGRKDNLIVTGHGRNLSPEWVESALHGSGAVRQVMICCSRNGEVLAHIVPDPGWLEEISEKLLPGDPGGDILNHPAVIGAMAEAVREASRSLPPYAAVKEITLSDRPFSVENGLMGADGRLNRKRVLEKMDEPADRQAAAINRVCDAIALQPKSNKRRYKNEETNMEFI